MPLFPVMSSIATSAPVLEKAADLSSVSKSESVLAERNRLWEELHQLKAERREVEYYENELTKMRASISWRITAPLRVGKRYALKVRMKIGR
jgi:hypothetical protein